MELAFLNGSKLCYRSGRNGASQIDLGDESMPFRLMRIMTGRPVLRDMWAGIDMIGYAPAFEPKPPPQYSAMKTRSAGS